MGSTVEGNREIDSSVGGLVWVRRRNGKWWPGRILGSDELPKGYLASPKPGTPVKLLGREDASVDWYNLEKSQRVKPFRCREYEQCIQKAKAAAATNSSKKFVKNARKEDAILHALEIESAHLGKGHPDFYLRMEKPDEGEKHTIEVSPSSFNPHEGETDNMEEDSSSSYGDSVSAQELSQSGVSYQDFPHHAKAQSVPGRWRRTPNDSEDDGTERVKRMKGLEDLGPDVVSSLKRKSSQVAHVHEFLKRRHRRRTMTKVLESSIMVSCKASGRKLSGLDSIGAKKSFSPKKENKISSMFTGNGSAGGLYDVPFAVDEKKLAGIRRVECNASQETYLGAQTRATQNESGFTSAGPAKIHNICQRIDNGSSEWPLKGKRSRHLSKTKRQDSVNYMEADDERDTYLAGTEDDVSTNRVKSNSFAEIEIDECRDQSKDTSEEKLYVSCATAELQAPQRLLPCRRSRFNINPKYEDFSLRHHSAVSSLFDVNIEVNASYRPRHVAYVSLKSKLNGKPIVGHPLKVVVLEGDDRLSGSGIYSSSYELGEDLGENTSDLGIVELDNEARSNLAESIPIKHTLQQHTSPTKSSKSRRNGFLMKRIRKLSSITRPHKQSAKEKKLVLEKLKGPAVACVPLKVVFSRISSAMNSSTVPALRVSAARNT